MFNNAIWALVGLNKTKGLNLSRSEKNEILFFPMMMKDPTGALLTSDLAAKKAIEASRLRKSEEEKAAFQKTAAAALVIANDLSGILKTLKSSVDAATIDSMNAAEIKKHIKEVVLPGIEYRISDEVQKALLAGRPDLSPVVNTTASDFSGLKELIK